MSIPEDIYAAARAADYAIKAGRPAEEAIALAIQQERENCALRARRVMIERVNEQHMIGQLHMQERIVTAIREG